VRKNNVRNGIVAVRLLDPERVARNSRKLLRNGCELVVVRRKEGATPAREELERRDGERGE
jgi:hypothetical protein